MKITLDKKEENLASITVVTEAGHGKEAYKKTAREFAQHVNVPGFRKGKAPIKMIEEQVGADRIKAETMNNLLSEVLYEAFEKEDLDVISIPNIDKVDFEDPEKEITIVATIELVPDVKLGNYKGISATINVPKFDEDDYLAKTLDRIAQQFATFEESKEACAKGDEATFDFAGKVKKTGEELDSLKAEGFQTLLEPERFVPEFVNQIVGMKAGDEKDITVTFPAEYHEERLKNEEVTFNIKMQKVGKAVLPEINDELAKKVQTEGVDDLKKRVIDEMKNIQEHNEKNASADALVKEVTELSTVDIPESMIKRETDAMLGQLKQRVQASGQKWEDIEKTIDQAEEKKIAIERIKRSLVLSAIIKKEKLEVGQEDMNEALQALQQSGQQINPEMLGNVRMEILSEKAIDFIRENAKLKINYVEEGHVHGPNCGHDHGEKPKKKTAAKKKAEPKAEKKETKKAPAKKPAAKAKK